MATPHDTTPTSTDLRDQIERYRTWLTETLATADAYIQDSPDISERAHGQADATFDALETLNAAVPPENPLAPREVAE